MAAAAAAAAPTAAAAAAAAAIGAVAVAAAYADHERKRRSGQKRKRDQLENQQQPALALQDFPPAYRIVVVKRLLPFAWNVTKWLQGQRRSDGVNIHRDLDFTRVCDAVAGDHSKSGTECVHCSNLHSLTSIMAGFVRGGLNLTRVPLAALVFKGHPITCLYRAIAPHVDFNQPPSGAWVLPYARVPHAVGMLLSPMDQPWPLSILDDVIRRTRPETLIHHQSTVGDQKVPLLHDVVRLKSEGPARALLRLANDDGTGLQITQQALDLARGLLPHFKYTFGVDGLSTTHQLGNESALAIVPLLETKADRINAHRQTHLPAQIDAATRIPVHQLRVLIAEYAGLLFDTCPNRLLPSSDVPAAAAAASAAPARL